MHFCVAQVLVEPLEGVKDGQLYGPAPPAPCLPPFRAVLADFGEARAYRNADEAYTARNRGTEVYKSPEMLLLQAGPAGAIRTAPQQPSRAPAAASQQQQARHTGAGLASDVWSFGCLAYELLSGKALFAEVDYASVTHRVALGSGERLALTKGEVAALGPHGEPLLQGLVEGVLVRDPAARPSLAAVQESLRRAREHVLALVAREQP